MNDGDQKAANRKKFKKKTKENADDVIFITTLLYLSRLFALPNYYSNSRNGFKRFSSIWTMTQIIVRTNPFFQKRLIIFDALPTFLNIDSILSTCIRLNEEGRKNAKNFKIQVLSEMVQKRNLNDLQQIGIDENAMMSMTLWTNKFDMMRLANGIDFEGTFQCLLNRYLWWL